MQYHGSEEYIYTLPLEKAIEEFVKRREAFLAEQDRQKQLTAESIKTFADSVLDKLNKLQQIKSVNRMPSIDGYLLPLRHRYDMHEHFPCLYNKIPEAFPSNCRGYDIDGLLAGLRDAVQEERDIALSSLNRPSE